MKFLFASDSFKGTLSSERITQLLEAAAGRTFPGCETAGVPEMCIRDSQRRFELPTLRSVAVCSIQLSY